MKPWYLSRTIWVQVVTVLVAIVTAVAGTEVVADHPQLVSILLVGLAALNAVLRWLTDAPITSFAKGLDKLRGRTND